MIKVLASSFCIFLIFISFSQINNEKIISVSNQDCKVYDANYIEGKTYKWQGGVKDNFANGLGVLSVFIGDAIYEKIEAQFINGVAEEKGKIERPEQEIIIQAKQIRTYDVSIESQPDCCSVFMPDQPNTHCKIKHLEADESLYPWEELMASALDSVETIYLDDLD